MPTELNEITRALTRQADKCIDLKQATISVQRMLEDIHTITGTLMETSETMQDVGLGP